MRYLLLLLLLLTGPLSQIQASELPAEQLLKALKVAEEDTEKFQLYSQLASHYQGSATDLTINYSLMAYNLAQQNQWTAQAFDGLAIGVQSMIQSGQFQEGGFRLLQLLRNLDPDQLRPSQGVLREAIEAKLQLRLANLEAARGYLEAAEAKLEDKEAQFAEPNVWMLRAEYNLQSGDTISAIGGYKQSLELLSNRSNSDFLKGIAYMQLAEIYLSLDDAEQCISYCQRLLNELPKANTKIRAEAQLFQLRAYAYLDLYKTFEEQAILVMASAKQSNLIDIQAAVLTLLAKHQFRLSTSGKRNSYYDQAIDFAQKEELLLIEKELLLDRQEFFLRKKQTWKANALIPALDDLYQRLVKAQRSEAGRIAQLQLMLADKEILLEDHSSQLKSSQKNLLAQKRSGYNNYLLVLLLIACAGALLYFLHQSLNARGQIEGNLEDRTKELKHTRQKLRETQVHLAANEAELQRVMHLSVQEIKIPVVNIEKVLQESAPSRQAIRANLGQIDFLLGEMDEYNRLRREGNVSATISLQESVMQVLENLKFEIERQGIIIEVEELPQIEGNETLMVQLFQNLIYDTMALPGSNNLIRIEHHENANEHCFSVKNATAIIGENLRSAINDLFGNYPAGQFHPIAGKPLSTVKKIIDEYKGKIWLEMDAGHGSVFHFTLPKEANYSVYPI